MQKCVCDPYCTRKSLNFDLTHLKQKEKKKNLVNISKAAKYANWAYIGFSSSERDPALEQAEVPHEHLLLLLLG